MAETKLKAVPKDIRNLQKPKPMSESDRRLLKLAAKRDGKKLVNIHDKDDPAPLLMRDDVLRKSMREID